MPCPLALTEWVNDESHVRRFTPPRRHPNRTTMLVLALSTLSFGRSALLRSPTPLLRHQAPACTVSEAPELDLVGDGGVLKRVLQAGSGESPVKGTTVEVHYDGTLLATGARFDSSRERGKTFKFTLGEGYQLEASVRGRTALKPIHIPLGM